MVGIIINIVLAVLLLGAVLYIINEKNNFKYLEQDYLDSIQEREKLEKEIKLLTRENNYLKEENTLPKTEKIRKPRKTKTKIEKKIKNKGE